MIFDIKLINNNTLEIIFPLKCHHIAFSFDQNMMLIFLPFLKVIDFAFNVIVPDKKFKEINVLYG